MTQSKLQTFLNALTEDLGLPPLPSEPSGNFNLSFDFRFNVKFLHLNEQAALMVSKCGRTDGLDDQRRDDLIKHCLELSLARMPESPAVITVEEDSSDLILYQFLDLQTLRTAEFQSQVEQYVDELNLWMQFISNKRQIFESRNGGNNDLVITP